MPDSPDPRPEYAVDMDGPARYAHNPSCGCGCNDYEPSGCPIPAPGINNRWCVNYPTLNCHCIALVSQGYCEGCYVATK